MYWSAGTRAKAAVSRVGRACDQATAHAGALARWKGTARGAVGTSTAGPQGRNRHLRHSGEEQGNGPRLMTAKSRSNRPPLWIRRLCVEGRRVHLVRTLVGPEFRTAGGLIRSERTPEVSRRLGSPAGTKARTTEWQVGRLFSRAKYGSRSSQCRPSRLTAGTKAGSGRPIRPSRTNQSRPSAQRAVIVDRSESHLQSRTEMLRLRGKPSNAHRTGAVPYGKKMSLTSFRVRCQAKCGRNVRTDGA